MVFLIYFVNCLEIGRILGEIYLWKKKFLIKIDNKILNMVLMNFLGVGFIIKK